MLLGHVIRGCHCGALLLGNGIAGLHGRPMFLENRIESG